MTQQDANVLADALRRAFQAEVDVELINGKDRFRFGVVSSRFQSMTQLERQDAVWEVVDKTLPQQATLDISLILTFAPGDLATSGAES
jgi:stress-induced morphogen